VIILFSLREIGKTQPSIQFARRSIDIYTSIFWLNAQDESTLKGRLVGLTAQIMEEQKSTNVYDLHEEEQMMQQIRQ
jgi:hypothetical protein